MIPTTLIPARFHLSAIKNEECDADNAATAEPAKKSLSDHAAVLLACADAQSPSRNMLLEERDRHLCDRLFRVAKIEAFARVLNNLQTEGEVSAPILSQIIEIKTREINDAGHEIWLNLITQEKLLRSFTDLWMRNNARRR